MAINENLALMSRSKRPRAVPLLILVGASVLPLLNPSVRCVACQFPQRFTQDSSNNADVELTRAREKAKSTQQKYEGIKRLHEKGSVSQRQLRRSDLERRVALLDYSSLLNPGRREQNLLLRAKVIMQFYSQELSAAKKLYLRGSMSKIDYLRSVAANDIAASSLIAASSASEAQRKIQAVKAANSKYELVLTEYEIATQLFESQAVSQTAFNKAASNLKIAESELEATKQSLGARAVRVKQ